VARIRRRTSSVALAALLIVASVAHADDASDFRDASTRRDIDALERIGAGSSMWADDAWVEAARIAEQSSDYVRARRDLEQAIATSRSLARVSNGSASEGDSILLHRAQGDLARITRVAGEGGEWGAVIAEEERLLPALQSPGDPRNALRALEQLAREHPGYPRAAMLMVQIAAGWEREGDPDRALAWLADASRAAKDPLDRLRARADSVRVLTRAGRLSQADEELSALTDASPGLIANLRSALERAKLRRDIRWAMWALLAILVIAAVVALRRTAGSWRAAGRRLVRPPIEAVFFVPIAGVLVAVASTGNPLVGRAVWGIAIAGVVTSWVTGALLAGSRVTLRRAIVHAVCAMLAVGAATYVAVDHGHLVDFLLETWREGPER
jgi:tetratricopeptide (TPR) repeat protein